MSLALECINERKPVLLIALGRQRVGKTVFLNTLAQYLKQKGARFEILNADLLNKTHTLTLFHKDTVEAPSTHREDMQAWLVAQFRRQMDERFDAILDVGGGDTPLERLIEEYPIVSVLQDHGICLVIAQVIGPDMADVDYLERFTERSTLMPDGMLIVFNGGLVLTGRSANVAFSEVAKHQAIDTAVDQGAIIKVFPRLPCMQEVTDRHLTFLEVMNGEKGRGSQAFCPFDQARVNRWWTVEVPEFFGGVPSEWLPAIPENGAASMPPVVGNEPKTSKKERKDAQKAAEVDASESLNG
ncbi:hypothetical protein [Beijerinckia mobilis]|uniref:hypothetical protein n=1 Tax=Beijerinckia mobilis TaxID=231434 RepID=UPI00055288C0|nr:hypothetical protein [Beijerinckia mobilis]